MNQQLAKYGTYTGLAGVALLLLLYFIQYSNNDNAQYVLYIVLSFGLFMSLKHYRDNSLGGYITYGKSVGSGTIITLFFSFLLSVTQYIIFKMDSAALEMMKEKAIEELYKGDLPEEQLEMSIEVLDMVLTPGMVSFSAFFGYSIMGMILTLITSIFIKKENPNPFSDVEGTLD